MSESATGMGTAAGSGSRGIVRVGKLAFVAPARHGVPLLTSAAGKVRQGYLDGTPRIGGVRYCCGIALWPTGKVRLGLLAESAVIGGVAYRGYIQYHRSGRVQAGKLTDTTRIDGVDFLGGQYVDFDDAGRVVAGCVAHDCTIGRTRVPAQAFVKLAPRRAVEVVDTRDLERDWALHGQSTKSCSITRWGFACGDSCGSELAEWGASCPYREFLLGELQEFPRAHFPAALPEMVRLAETALARVSDVPLLRLERDAGAAVPP